MPKTHRGDGWAADETIAETMAERIVETMAETMAETMFCPWIRVESVLGSGRNLLFQLSPCNYTWKWNSSNIEFCNLIK
jgi:hypothetical protein